MFVTLDKLAVDAARVPACIDSQLTDIIADALGIKPAEVRSYKIVKRSVDARKKTVLLYRICAEISNSARPHRMLEPCSPPDKHEYGLPDNRNHLNSPVIVGAGPAGLFAALVLAMAGTRPVILERGRDVTRRRQDIEKFMQTRSLDPESNFLYGEGGAGTWSDGKLFTRVRDPRMNLVMETFVACGAPEAILYFSHPHLGSDKLPGIIENLRNKIIALGGSFRWDSSVRGIFERSPGVCGGVELVNGERIEAPAVLIACGHSARELIVNLTARGVAHALKPFQVGIRIEHPQAFVNRARYGNPASYPALGAADYSLALSPAGDLPGAASFCMCPGGEIIPAVTQPGTLCTNGMSNAARSGKFANSAIVSTIQTRSFSRAAEPFEFLEKLERQAYALGGGGFTAPAQGAADFLARKKGPVREHGSYAFGCVPARLDKLLPGGMASTLSAALRRFDRMMPGFIRDGVFNGIETRVSSPVRFLRDELSMMSPGMKFLYMAGEGAGMAGGITSAAIDGIKLAEAMLKY